jgi:DNA-binding transcriptional ArsR family regulator
MPEPKVSADKVLHALGDPTRRAIVELLSVQPHSVSYLADQLKITLTAVGQHLQILEETGLARTEKKGRVRTASLASPGFDALENWIRQRRNEWDLRLDRLGKFLGEID